MGVRQSTPSSARRRHYRRRVRRALVLLLVAMVLSVVVCGSLAYPVLAPDVSLSAATPSATAPEATREMPPYGTPTAQLPQPSETPTVGLPTQAQIVPPSQDTHILYYVNGGDSLPVVSLRFGVDIDEITSPDPITTTGLLPPGQLLILPNRLSETSSGIKLLPDSEAIFSPAALYFDIQAFVEEAGGYLADYSEYFLASGKTTGAEIIARVALDYSINPRLLLAALEGQSGWVYGQPKDDVHVEYPMGYVNRMKKGLYLQCAWFASKLLDGYYGWREGRLLVLTFEDGRTVRLAPQLNAGTVGLMTAYAGIYGFEEWALYLYGEEGGFFELYEGMFGNPWIRALAYEPLIPVDTEQPEMILPFEIGHPWAFTGGPHAAWGVADVWAALDFAPGTDETGCHESNAWVVASMSGLVVRSGNGVVVIDQDGDGFEQTGWNLLYLHIATKDRIEAGTWVDIGDRIGHPSCEGGRATGTHIHMVRRYNGEWVPADGPLPFVLSGWQAKAGIKAYDGWLIRGSDIIYAKTTGTFETQIQREE